MSVIVGLGLSFAAQANTVSYTLPAGSFTNLLSLNNGFAKITQVILSAGASNAAVQLWDTPTNSFTFTNAAYTNMISYLTNMTFIYSNYYGGFVTNTNTVLVDITNSVPISTNNYPLRIALAALPNTSVSTVGGINYYFNDGVWGTNTSQGTETVTITYQQ